MKRLLLSLLIAIPISLVIAVLLFFASAFAGGACHCMTPVSVFFPYGTFITMRTRFETAGFYCDLLQFPLYATVIATLNNWKRRSVGAAALLVLHAIAAVGAVTMYRWW
jgi:hypothetical protein